MMEKGFLIIIMFIGVSTAAPEKVEMSDDLLFGAVSHIDHLPVEKRYLHSFIISGSQAEAFAYPWIISLQVWSRKRNKWVHVCGGVIANSEVIVTAGHCFYYWWKRRVHRVAAGWHELQENAHVHQQNVYVASVRRHPYYTVANGVAYNDIGLLFLSHKLAFSRFVQPANFSGEARVGEDCVVAGWGRTTASSSRLPPTLMATSGQVISRQLCEELWRLNLQLSIADTNICLFSSRNGTGRLTNTCNGDSGGPLMCGNVTVGLVSWGRARCVGCSPDVYTRLASFLQWIRRYAPEPTYDYEDNFDYHMF